MYEKGLRKWCNGKSIYTVVKVVCSGMVYAVVKVYIQRTIGDMQ